jgi:hypothetical protein
MSPVRPLLVEWATLIDGMVQVVGAIAVDLDKASLILDSTDCAL